LLTSCWSYATLDWINDKIGLRSNGKSEGEIFFKDGESLGEWICEPDPFSATTMDPDPYFTYADPKY